ncbi:MAG TPA: radical SAM peptide maturase [Bacteroidales bacterium]|nr:radical SAM peptide maturase [Bacteroidales bacterium]
MNEHFLKIKGNDIKSNLVNLSQIVFEVTDVCNLRCKYCGYGELYEGYDPRGRGNLSLKKACNILDYLAELWKENIGTSLSQPIRLSFYGGEPLMNMMLIKEIIQYAESLNITGKRFYYNMTTNGLLLIKHMDYLAEKEFELLISLDGNEKDHSYRVDHRGRNSHKQVVENIRLLKQKFPDYFKKHVDFNTVLHNMNSVESAHNYIKNNFGKETKIASLNNSGIRKDKVNEFINMFQNKDSSIDKSGNREKLEAELFLEAPRTRQLTNYFYMFSGNMFDNYSSLFCDVNKIEIAPTGTCTPFYKKMFITVTGKILQCEKINHEFAMGRVSDDKVEMDFDHIAEIANDYIFRFIRQCNTCVYIRRCSQCVFQIDEINSSDPKCYSYTSDKSFQNSINENLDFLGKNPGLYKKIMKDVQIRN